MRRIKPSPSWEAQWQRLMGDSTLKRWTLRDYRGAFLLLLRFLVHIGLTEALDFARFKITDGTYQTIDRATLVRFFAWVDATVPGRHNDAVAGMRHLTNQALERGEIGEDPMPPRVKLWPQRETIQEALTVEEAERLLLAAADEQRPWPARDVFLVRFVLVVGPRAAEVCNVLAADIDAEGAKVYFDREREIKATTGASALTKAVVRDYEVYRRTRRFRERPTERLFVDDLGRPFRPKTLRAWLVELLEAAGIDRQPDLRLFRRTMITTGYLAGIPLPALQRQARHVRLGTTVRYIHGQRAFSELRDAVNRAWGEDLP